MSLRIVSKQTKDTAVMSLMEHTQETLEAVEIKQKRFIMD